MGCVSLRLVQRAYVSLPAYSTLLAPVEYDRLTRYTFHSAPEPRLNPSPIDRREHEIERITYLFVFRLFMSMFHAHLVRNTFHSIPASLTLTLFLVIVTVTNSLESAQIQWKSVL